MSIIENFKMIHAQIEQTAKTFNQGFPTLIAVSKRQAEDRVIQALENGHRVFGENQVQEAYERWEKRRTQYLDLKLHCLGPLQSNKVKKAVALFDVIHTVDREKIAHKISEEAQEQKRHIECFIQVNTGAEDQKSGVLPAHLTEFYYYCTKEVGLSVIGLMAIPPVDDLASYHFAFLKKKAHELGLKNLSMGMSDDFETAIQFGSTHIRLGSALFGER